MVQRSDNSVLFLFCFVFYCFFFRRPVIIRHLACTRLTVWNSNAQHMLETMTIDSAAFTSRIMYPAATLVSASFKQLRSSQFMR